ncbi:MAG: MarC family protein [Salinivirgaceae bacterium]|nr:MarC family protein [Salinivirgaceae bacterium]MDD4747469.1 MarC family protein [Salinivirgaceae bacterium]MDY0281135.1 MarC family protein [Salinivirgaceae bacterium]
MDFSIIEIASAFMVLFAVIDPIGAIPIILDLKAKGNKIESEKVAFLSFGILLAFLILGEPLLGVFGVDIASFAIAGSFVLFILGMEMVLEIEIFKGTGMSGSSSIVPITFPLIAGAGSITTLLSLKAEYTSLNIGIAMTLNIVVVYIILKMTRRIEKFFGQTGIMILRKTFGIILLAIAIRLFMSNLAVSLQSFFPELFI